MSQFLSEMNSGWWLVGHWKGAPVRLHWTIAPAALFFSRFSFAPGIWIGVFLVVLLHEMGHAVMVRRFGLWVDSIDVHGLGGLCRWGGRATHVARGCIAWGGVLAQLALFAVAQGIAALDGPRTTFSFHLHYALTASNLWIAALNLIPVRPLDGVEAWSFVATVWRNRVDAVRRWRSLRQRRKAKEKAARAELARIEAQDHAPVPDGLSAEVSEILKKLADKKDPEE